LLLGWKYKHVDGLKAAVMLFGFHKESRPLLDKLSGYQFFKEYPAPWSKYVSK
jgi:hypothetical protein